jgi:hypothetical protein
MRSITWDVSVAPRWSARAACRRCPLKGDEQRESSSSTDHDAGRYRQADGTVRAGDPHELAVVLFASVHGIAALTTADLLDGVSRERAVEGAIDVAWRGIAGSAAS